MNDFKKMHFEFFHAQVKAQTQEKIFDILAEDAAPLCKVETQILRDAFARRLSERTFGMGDGVSIFDVKSEHVKRPVLAMMNFEHDIDFNALDSKPVRIMAAVISPQSDGPLHLQRLASVARLLRCDDLCQALKDARNEDEMRVLFMPSQDWMVAA